MSTTWDLYCCFLPQCEALRTCRLVFPITTKWCFDQDVKVVPGANFSKWMCDRCSSLQKGGDVVATSQLMLRWKCDSPEMGCAQWATHKYMWREQAIIEWFRRVISIIACCHKIACCVRAFWSQHKKYISLSFECLIPKNQNFLENVKSAAQFRSIDLILAMTVYLPVRHSLCTRSRFTVLVSCSELAGSIAWSNLGAEGSAVKVASHRTRITVWPDLRVTFRR